VPGVRHRLTPTRLSRTPAAVTATAAGVSSRTERQQKGDEPEALADTTMIWIALCLPLMIVGVAIALLPLIWAMVHERRSVGSGNLRRTLPGSIAPLPMENSNGAISVCAICSSVVLDIDTHVRAVHRLAA